MFLFGGKQAEDSEVLAGISGLVKENIEVLGGRTSAEVQLEQDVRESLLSMAKQSGKVDPDVRSCVYYCFCCGLCFTSGAVVPLVCAITRCK